MIITKFVIHFRHFPELDNRTYWCTEGYVAEYPNDTDDCGLQDAQMYDTFAQAFVALEELLIEQNEPADSPSQYTIIEVRIGVFDD